MMKIFEIKNLSSAMCFRMNVLRFVRTENRENESPFTLFRLVSVPLLFL